MNDHMDIAELPCMEHLNLAQKRVLILRDLLKHLEAKHLDTFLVGIEDPEPPNYRCTEGRVHPPLTEITLKGSATRLDLGNVIFSKEGQADRVARVHFSIEQGKCEMSESDALPAKDDDLNSVPIHVIIVEQMVELFANKYKAIDTRKRCLNELRRVARGAASQPRVCISAGKSLAALNIDSQRNQSFVNGKIGCKRASNDPLPKHITNKRKHIGLEDISTTAKTAIFDRIPGRVKADLFDNIVKTALPNFDNILTAAWNVVYIHKNTGSEDRALYESITCLERVLLEFSAYHRSAKIKAETQVKTTPEQGEPDVESGRVASLSEATSNEVDTDIDQCRNVSPTEIAKSKFIGEEKAAKIERNAGPAGPRDMRTGSQNPLFRVEYDGSTRIDAVQPIDDEHEAMLAAKVMMLKGRLNAYQANSSSSGPRQHCQKNSPRRTPPNGGTSHLDNDMSPRSADVCREQQQQQQQQQQKHIFNSERTAPQDQRHVPSTNSQKPNRTNKTTDTHRQVFTDGFNEYLEDMEQEDTVGQIESPRRPASQAIFLGRSKLGAPKLPSNAMGSAPVAPMEHIHKDSGSGGGGERRGRPMA